jgi:hypothetical protein
MRSLLECSARAALCRQLANLEPDSKNLWLAEADRWSRLREPDAEADRGHAEPAETWCWMVRRRHQPVDVKPTEVQMQFRNVAGRDSFADLLSDLSRETGEPH